MCLGGGGGGRWEVFAWKGGIEEMVGYISNGWGGGSILIEFIADLHTALQILQQRRICDQTFR